MELSDNQAAGLRFEQCTDSFAYFSVWSSVREVCEWMTENSFASKSIETFSTNDSTDCSISMYESDDEWFHSLPTPSNDIQESQGAEIYTSIDNEG